MGTITRLDEQSLKAYRPSPCTFKMVKFVFEPYNYDIHLGSAILGRVTASVHGTNITVGL